mmetsp:Transcript_5414/g.7943  ORF Transcript_5414/g.7943 Transcript_5414/m.7943 type:complete len:89 (-) Transcript_5414:2575-2841(-)
MMNKPASKHKKAMYNLQSTDILVVTREFAQFICKQGTHPISTTKSINSATLSTRPKLFQWPKDSIITHSSIHAIDENQPTYTINRAQY